MSDFIRPAWGSNCRDWCRFVPCRRVLYFGVGQKVSGRRSSGVGTNIFSTDPASAANGFVALEDTKRLFGSKNIVPLVRADRAEEVKEALNAVSAALTTESIAEMLKKTDIDKADPKTVAQEFLTTNSLG